MTKGHNFVKNMTIKNPKSHLQIMVKHSAKFQINWIKDVAGVAGTSLESARAITPPKMAKIKNMCTYSDHKKTIYKFQINSTKDVGEVVRTRFRMDGRMDRCTGLQTRVISIVPLPVG